MENAIPLIHINHQNKEFVNFPVLWGCQPYFSTYQHEVLEREHIQLAGQCACTITMTKHLALESK